MHSKHEVNTFNRRNDDFSAKQNVDYDKAKAYFTNLRHNPKPKNQYVLMNFPNHVVKIEKRKDIGLEVPEDQIQIMGEPSRHFQIRQAGRMPLFDPKKYDDKYLEPAAKGAIATVSTNPMLKNLKRKKNIDMKDLYEASGNNDNLAGLLKIPDFYSAAYQDDPNQDILPYWMQNLYPNIRQMSDQDKQGWLALTEGKGKVAYSKTKKFMTRAEKQSEVQGMYQDLTGGKRTQEKTNAVLIAQPKMGKEMMLNSQNGVNIKMPVQQLKDNTDQQRGFGSKPNTFNHYIHHYYFI